MGKDSARPAVRMTVSQWSTFVQYVRGRSDETGSDVRITMLEDGWIKVSAKGQSLVFDSNEWAAFLRDAALRHFSLLTARSGAARLWFTSGLVITPVPSN